MVHGETWYMEQRIKARKPGPKSTVPKLNSRSDAVTDIGMFKIPAQLVFDSGGSYYVSCCSLFIY